MRWLFVLFCVASCDHRPQVPSAYLTHHWQLHTLNGMPFTAPVTIDVRRSGLVVGTMPCNRFSGTLTRFPDAWEFGPIGIRNAPCPQGNAEAAFMQAITVVTRARVEGVRLILSGPGIQLEFARTDDRKFTPM
jgi:heat shock protein HslJ